MRVIAFSPSLLCGTVKIIPSKSYAHRALIIASMAKGKSTIHDLPTSEDVDATKEALKHFGTIFEGNNIQTNQPHYDGEAVQCFASGSTLRMLIPYAMSQFETVTFTGIKRLFERPLDVYETLFKDQIKKVDTHHLQVFGPINTNVFDVDGSKSSQFISGLLMMSPLLKKDVEIHVIHGETSSSYVNMTLDVMKQFGVHVKKLDCTYIIAKNQQYMPTTISIEGDYSQAAFFLVAGIIGEKIHITGLKKTSLQGDYAIINILQSMGGHVQWHEEGWLASPSVTHGITIDLDDIPDLGPILMILAGLSKGTTTFLNVDRLTYKESDRLHTMITILSTLGVSTYYKNNVLEVTGIPSFKGNLRLSSQNDHRIAMAIAIASIRSQGEIILEDANAINKSYPQFYDVFQSLGGVIHDN